MLNPLCKIKEEAITISALTVRLLRVTNIDELFNALVAKDADSVEVQDERIPYWADLWPSSIALSQYMIENKMIGFGTKVLEIGCGLGLPGVIAGMQGGDVTFTDYMPEPLDLAKKNWELNNEHAASFELLDWRAGFKESGEEVILASDVAYESRMFKPLLEFVRQACEERKTILLSEPGRKLAIPFLEELVSLDLVRSSKRYKISLNGIDTFVTVYELRKA